MILIICMILASVAAIAQPGSPTLEVATIKRLNPSAPIRFRMSAHGGPGTTKPTLFDCRGCPLALLIAKAYDLDLYQVSGPDWVMEDLFEVNAKVPENASLAQFQQMFQSLLADRFHLKTRRETRESAGYELVLGPGGSKMKKAGPPAEPPDKPVSPLTRLDALGFPILRPGEPMAMALQHYRRQIGETMSDLIRFLTLWLGKAVVDRTGLIGRYETSLTFIMPRPNQAPTDEPDIPGPTLVDAVRKNGLRLVPKKVQVEYIVVESAQRIPDEN